MTKSVNIW